MFRERAYQEKAINAMVSFILSGIERNAPDGMRYYLQAPTGSGKTFILARIIKTINQELKGQVAFIWTTIGKGDLPTQAKEDLNAYLNKSGMNIYTVAEALEQCPNNMANTITVMGWDILNKTDKNGDPINTVMKVGEKTNFPEMCENTRKAGIPIIHIVDEAHSHEKTERSKQIIQKYIQPTVVVGSSATLNPNDYYAGYKVDYYDVVKSGMIKKKIEKSSFETYENGIISAANRLNNLATLAETTKATYNPKMLIFAPNATHNNGKASIELADILLVLKDKFNWTEENGSVVVWLSTYKTPGYLICKENNSKIKAIITKEAIDTGIDIPSIQVIVQLRPLSGRSEVQVQRIGRGLRMPERKHYGNELDTLYVSLFNDYELSFEGAEDLKEAMGVSETKLRAEFQHIILPPIKRTYAESQPSFIENELLFGDLFPKHFKSVSIDLDLAKTHYEVIEENGEIDLDNKKNINGIDIVKQITETKDIDYLYEHRMKSMLKHRDKHRKIISISLIERLQDNNIEVDDTTYRIICLNNLSAIEGAILNTVRLCENELYAGNMKCKKEEGYSLPVSMSYNRFHDEKPFSKYAYEICRWKPANTMEMAFARRMDNEANVLCWYVNPQRNENSFSACYQKADNTISTFFPDFIVVLKSGTILILDTKGNNSDAEETNKLTSLIERLKDHDDKVIGRMIKADMANTQDYHFYVKGDYSLEDLFNK